MKFGGFKVVFNWVFVHIFLSLSSVKFVLGTMASTATFKLGLKFQNPTGLLGGGVVGSDSGVISPWPIGPRTLGPLAPEVPRT